MNGFGLGSAWEAGLALIRRHSRSKAVREAEKRRVERRRREAARRAKESTAVAGVSAVGMFGYALTVAPVASAAVAAGAAGIGAIALVHLWRTRKPKGRHPFSSEELVALPTEAEEWLLDQRALLPSEAGPALDKILIHLADLPPHLGRLDPAGTLAWEARRLIGEHLPGLVGSWCLLPSTTREKDRAACHRFVLGLGTIAEELERLCVEASRDERMSLETRSRFLETRYGEDRLSIR